VRAAEPPPALGLGARLVLAGFWLLGGLPLRMSHRLGALWGRSRRGRVRHIVERNLALCFPELDAAARGCLADASLAEAGRSMLEAFRIWTRPRAMLARIVRVDGEDALAAARADGRGVLLLAPHLGAWELLNLYLADTGPGAVLYKPPASPAWARSAPTAAPRARSSGTWPGATWSASCPTSSRAPAKACSRRSSACRR
jgi:KDO2-lipid IV(A) lauroyltransferase